MTIRIALTNKAAIEIKRTVGKFRLISTASWLRNPDDQKKVGGRFGQPVEIPGGRALESENQSRPEISETNYCFSNENL